MQYRFYGKRLEITPPLRAYAQKKFQALSRLLKKENASLEIEIERETRHHKKGPVFFAKATLGVGAKSPIFAEAESYDARSAIDIARDILLTEFRKFCE